jgi:TATA-box binding protein (TBP) (component of TFIID and TFIIIB)
MNKLGWTFWETKRPRMLRARTKQGTLLVTARGKLITMGCKSQDAANTLIEQVTQQLVGQQFPLTKQFVCHQPIEHRLVIGEGVILAKLLSLLGKKAV